MKPTKRPPKPQQAKPKPTPAAAALADALAQVEPAEPDANPELPSWLLDRQPTDEHRPT